jgi:hypothetical protein
MSIAISAVMIRYAPALSASLKMLKPFGKGFALGAPIIYVIGVFSLGFLSSYYGVPVPQLDSSEAQAFIDLR